MESITLKMLRERCNLTQQQVADILNKSVSAYSKIERGENSISIDEEGILADLLGVDIGLINSVCSKDIRKMQFEEELDLFSEPESNSLQICYSNFEKVTLIDDYKELFKGFTRLRVITFSSSAFFIAKMLKDFNFKKSEIIFGNKRLFYSMTYLKELIMDSDAIINVFTGMEPSYVDFLKEQLKNEQLYINIACPNALSHEKVFLLWNEDNDKKRVITGSANMSLQAYLGRQKENIIVYDNDTKAFEYFYNRYEEFLSHTTCRIEPENLKKITGDTLISDNPIIKNIIKNNNTCYIDVNPVSDDDDFKGYYEFNAKKIMALLDEHSKAFNNDIFDSPKGTKSAYVINPAKCRSVISTYKLLHSQQQEATTYPEFRVDSDMKAYFNNDEYICNYERDNVIKDINILKNFFNGYSSGNFIGHFNESLNLAIEKYYASIVYAFISPFLHHCIKLSGNGIDSYVFPTYLILRGPKSAGKTPFCGFVLQLMFNQYKLNISEMSGLILKSKKIPSKNKGGLVPAMLSGKGFPVIIDELTRDRARDYEGIIKDPSYYREPCSCVIFTCNDDFEVSDYIVKRSVLFNLDISYSRSGSQKVNSAISELHNITGDLYKCFYKRFSKRFVKLLDDLENIRYAKNNDIQYIPDVFKLGSETLKEIIEEYSSIDENETYIRIYDSNFYRDGQSNLEERKKKFIDDFEFGEWSVDKEHNLIYKVFEGMDGKSKAKEFSDAMNQYGSISAHGNKVRIKLDWAIDFFNYDFINNYRNTVGMNNSIERVEVEKIKEVEVEAEKPKGFVNKMVWLFSNK